MIPDVLSMNLDDARHIIYESNPEIQILNGRWGPYIKYKKKNYKIPKTTEAKDLSLEECLEMIKKQDKIKKKK